MCGIAGILSDDELHPIIQKMVTSMHLRGPDDHGQYISNRIALGNARLAIIDLSSAGHMPMTNPATGDWIAYNGEIYNFPDLRRELEAHGHRFSSETDTEVILKGYETWGISCVEHLRGMFAFALWDAHKCELFLARDRIGEKPLYYVEDRINRRFLFASEIRTLLVSGLVERKLDQTSLSSYLYNGFTIAPRTILEHAQSLLPGYWMRVSVNGEVCETHRYWQVPIYQKDAAKVDPEQIRSVLAEAVKMRLISEVPLGAFLSGGLDSSTIVALMTRFSGQVRTFSIGFADQTYDETPYARWVADHFRTNHTEIKLGPKEFSAWLDDGLSGMDQPTFDGLNTYFVSRAARESGLKVALSGLGGDELFGGYPFFKSAPLLAHLARTSKWMPNPARSTIARKLGESSGMRKAFHLYAQPIPPGMELLAAYQSSLALVPYEAQKTMLANAQSKDVWFGLPSEFVMALNQEGHDNDKLSLLSRYVLRLFEGERTLRDSDSMSMSVSLEVRTVFTDHKLIETLWRLPGRVRCAGAPDKTYEEAWVRPILGDGYLSRKKQGFIFPFESWLKSGKIFEQIKDTMLDRSLAQISGLDPRSLVMLQKNSLNLPWSRIWSVFVLMNWLRQNNVSA
jgi:asparagine synthase (glutamine-hydrolysing)